ASPAPQAMAIPASPPIDAEEGPFADYEQIAVLLSDDGGPRETIVDAIVARGSSIIGSALAAPAPAATKGPKGPPPPS
ncbi:hypothetical protein, partial [Microbacterium sp. GbtcB4]|uniref:hypothetical protein n=1 Tax=Microbacterium sp. GbtcB4 TaxID=2824749 RepID=UPI001C301B95